jgi:hypothetical protein
MYCNIGFNGDKSVSLQNKYCKIISVRGSRLTGSILFLSQPSRLAGIV